MKIKLFLVLAHFFLLNKVFPIVSNLHTFENNKLSLLIAERNDSYINLGLYFQLKPGWKIYWPVPEELYEKDIDLTTRVYTDNIIIPIDLYLNKNNMLKKNIKFSIDYQICKEICIPLNAELEIKIPGNNYFNKKNTVLLNEYRKKIPKQIKLNEKYSLNYIKKNFNKIIVSLKRNNNLDVLDKKHLRVFIHGENLPTYRMKRKIIKEEEIIFELVSNTKLKNYNKEISAFFQIKNDTFFVKTKVINEESTINIRKVIFLIFTSLLAGFILNFMPCVLPVLGIKITNFLTQLETQRKSRVQKASIYVSSGIIFTFLSLAILTIILRVIGINIGWGMQFQEPAFLIFLIIILCIFLINLLGIFNLFPNVFLRKTLKANDKVKKLGFFWNNFSTGVVSTILATPCTAPFVGTAVSFALSQSYFMTLIIFLSMGIGKALPYFIFIFNPNAIKFFPKPGAWMKYIKFFFALLLMFTILWLGKITINSLNNEIDKKVTLTQDWEKFSIANLKKYIKEDKAVFVDITADWCVTCQINKKLVFEDKEIIAIFKEQNIILLRADWTFANDEILSFLKSHDKYGVPFNIIYSKSYPNGFVFKEMLLKKTFIKKIKDLLP